MRQPFNEARVELREALRALRTEVLLLCRPLEPIVAWLADLARRLGG